MRTARIMDASFRSMAGEGCGGLGVLAFILAAILGPSSSVGQQPTTFGSASGVTCPGGNVLCNGSINFMTTELFFEPETPPFTLKEGNLTWNEIEQLLDDPYSNVTSGAACNDVSGPQPTNFTGYPAYCTTSTFMRRPSFRVNALGAPVPLPPLQVAGLNYNPAIGAEMRALNPTYAGTAGFVNSGVVAGQATGVCYTLGTSCTPMSSTINVTPGASRGLLPGDHEIDYSTAMGRKMPFCQTNAEPVPLGGAAPMTPTPFGGPFATSFDSENLMTCGSDPGEPGAASLAHNPSPIPALFALQCGSELLGAGSVASYLCEDNVGLPMVGSSDHAWYSVPAVRAPNAFTALLMQIPNGTIPGVTTGTSIPVTTFTGNYLREPGTGAGIRPLNPVTGVGGLKKPSLRVAGIGGTTIDGSGINPNYLINACAAGSSSSACDNNTTYPSNENDYVGLFPTAAFPGTPNTTAAYHAQKQAARLEAMVLGKALFWDQQAGSDGVQSCGSCHAHAGADNRTKNQVNPFGQHGISGPPTNFNTNPSDPAAFTFPPNHDFVASDFPLHKLTDPDIAGDPLCTPALVANVAGISFPDGDPPDHPKNPSTFTVCDAANIVSDTDDVASSMGVHFGLFGDIPAGTGTGLANAPGATSPFGPPSNGVRALIHDQRSSVALGATAAQAAIDNIDPIAGFQGAGILQPDGTTIAQFRRVEPRNTPTIFLEDVNFDNFWDGRARHDDNGGSVFGSADPQAHVFVSCASTLASAGCTPSATGSLTATRQRIRFSSVASLAKGPTLSKFEMSFLNRNWAKVGKKFLQAGVTPLANQLVDPTDSILGRYSNQNGSACAALPAAQRSPYLSTPTTLGTGVPGLCISYPALVQHAFYPALYQNTSQHLNGCYTDGRADIHPNQCGTTVGTTAYPAASISVLENGAIVQHDNDPFDLFVLNIAPGPALPTDTNQFTQMEGNFSLFWGQSIHIWATILVPDDTPDDQFLDANPDIGMTTGETGEPLLVLDAPSCTNVPAGYVRDSIHPGCFTEVGNFKRDNNLTDTTVGTTLPAFTTDANGNRHYFGGACLNQVTIAGIRTCTQRVAAPGTRDPNANPPQLDPLLGFDMFFGSNASLKNPQFRSARCGACHNAPSLTDHTVPFTLKAQLTDAQPEFEKGTPTNEPLEEPLSRMRVITGFLLESEIADNGGDAMEGNVINLSIVPAPVVNNNGNCTTANCSGYAFPDGITVNSTITGYTVRSDLGIGPVAGPGVPVPYTSFGHSFFDNGVYNIGVRPCVADQTHVIGACEDEGRGDNDPFGWPMSLAAVSMKNLGGPAQQPGTSIALFDPSNANAGGRGDAQPCAPYCATGGLYELTKQDQQINPGYDVVPVSQLPAYIGPYAIPGTHGDGHPQQDEVCGPPGACINTLTDSANNEGFGEFPFDPRPGLSEVINSATASFNSTIGGLGAAEQGTWPVVNRVTRFGSIKAPQLREVELTGPYFHNGGKLTLRQVVDFYVRGGDFPVTNSAHRDFNILNLNAELQSDLSEEEKVALVDYMLEFTDDRVRFERAPFDRPEMILPLDGTAPESGQNVGTLAAPTFVNRDVMLAGCVDTVPPNKFGPGQQACDGGMFLHVPAVGAAGGAVPLPNFLNIVGAGGATDPLGRPRLRLVGADASGPACNPVATSQYCH
jgi:cytochrome c peroxidase